MSEEICELVITAHSPDWLANLANDLVKDRLAACAQMFPHVRSTYWWNDEIEESTEARLAIHTRVDLIAEIVQRTTPIHPYTTPCIIALGIVACTDEYLEWVLDATKPMKEEICLFEQQS